MLFFEKENVFMCLAATKFVLRKINSGVWFIQTFLQKMLYMPNFPHTSSTVNMQIMNQFHTHSQKKQNPAKKFIKFGQIEIAQRRRRWDRVVKVRSEARLVRSFDERRNRRSRSMRALVIAIDEGRDRLTSALVGQSRRSSIAVLFLLARQTIAPLIDRRLSLLPLSLSLIWAFSSLSLSLSLSLSGNDLNWK